MQRIYAYHSGRAVSYISGVPGDNLRQFLNLAPCPAEAGSKTSVRPATQCRHRVSRRQGFVVLLIALVATAAAHARDDAPPRGDSFTLYAGQGVDSDLLDLPGDLLDGSLDFENSYFNGIGYQRGTATPHWLDAAFKWIHINGVTTAVELVAVKHRGLQNHFEADVAYVIHTPQGSLGPVTLRAAASYGLSYAFGNPTYEDTENDDSDKRYRFQNYNAYELEWGLERYPKVSLVTRVHHRSGVYGIIAPGGVGSNFLTAGVRVRW